MKYCPICQTRYDEEIMRFCTKDGTPLIDEKEPSFTEMPSESLESDTAGDTSDEETIVRRKTPVSEPVIEPPKEDSQRLVVPITADQSSEPQVRTRTASYTREQPPPKSNTALVVLATMFGTIIVLGGAAGFYWLLSSGNGENDVNVNTGINFNQDTNLNTNLPIDNSLFNTNLDTNLNANVNANVNTNVNLRTPTPTPTPSPTPTRTPTPSPTPDEDDEETNTNANTSIPATPANTRPTLTPSPRTTPTLPPSNTPVNVGNLTNRAINLAKPPYPSAARTLRARGEVVVRVLVDESGRVLSANAVSGHPLLRQAAEQAARQSRFNPHRISGQTVKSAGTVVYNFVDN